MYVWYFGNKVRDKRGKQEFLRQPAWLCGPADRTESRPWFPDLCHQLGVHG
jgi:hypothetical protein